MAPFPALLTEDRPAQPAPPLTQEILSPWAGCAPPPSHQSSAERVPKAERAERSERSTSRVFRCRILPSAGRGRLAAKVARLAREVASSAQKVTVIGSRLAATCPICSCSCKNGDLPCAARRGRGRTKPKRAPPLLSPQVGYLVFFQSAGARIKIRPPS